MKISKHSYDLGNYLKTGVKVQKYPQIKTLFCLFQSQKHALIVHYSKKNKNKNLNTLE